VVKYKVLIPGNYVLSAKLRRIHIGVMYDACKSPTEQCFKGSPVSELVITLPYALNPKPLLKTSEPRTLNPEPQHSNPKPQTLNSQP
jgi:hypothetical protein